MSISVFFNKTTFLFLFICCTFQAVKAQILTNGDFESGGSGTGFLVHNYTLINPLNGTSFPGFYARTTNPILMNTNYISGGDHTTGSGNMLVIDGATITNRFFWTTGSTGGAINGFTAGTTYTFSYWIKSVSNEVTSNATTRSNIGVFFINATAINPTSLNNLAPLPSQGWQKVSFSFVATANNAMVRLQTLNAGAIGNDFAIDDVSITLGGLPFVGTYTTINPTCPTSTDGSIKVNLSGGTLPYGTYTLSGTVSQTNTNGLFNGLPEGTYSISAIDGSGQVYTQTAVVLAAPNNILLSNPATICQGETIPLSASGATGNYTWTANPPDNSISNPNSSTQNVSPSTTTTYTVTSGVASSTTNLVINGNFSQGNTGFTTEYNQIEDPNPFGVQSSYNVVTNPSSWFSAFASCGDHTTGTGNLIVFDGSTDPTGTIKVWCPATPIAVLPNKSYTFSYYMASVAPQNPAKLEVLINGVSIAPPVTAPSSTCAWTLVSHTWNSGSNTTATICIYNREFLGFGNDFALDDISFVETVTCLYTKTVAVTVNPKITPNFNAVNPICAGAILPNLPTTSLNGYVGTWLPALNNLATTTYTFTPNAGQCALPTSRTVVVNPLPDFSIAQGCNSINYTLTAEELTTSGSTYQWYTPSNNPIGTGSSVIVSAAGTYKLVVTKNGCSTEKSIIVTAPFCSIQKGISPNDDGKNDTFDLSGYNVEKLKIFNRYGVVVYEKAAYENEWYGQSDKGNQLPDGTYYYLIDFADLETKTGWIYINRAQ